MENLPLSSAESKQPITPEQALVASIEVARKIGVDVFKQDNNNTLTDDTISEILDTAGNSESPYAPAAPVTVNLKKEYFSPVADAGEHGLNAFRILEGEANLRVIHKKSATETPVTEGDIVVLDASEKTFYSFSSVNQDKELIVEPFRNEIQDTQEYERSISLSTNDETGRSWLIEKEQHEQQKAQKRWERYMKRQNKVRRRLGGRAIGGSL